ncbi:Y-family DNA polymerase [Dyadobacter psychrotolerans]|uniref:DNA polymerase Y family protein n=1 Tax=Dyadobacter psychrotolerans TaxID=2541721 RepID=A0A4R5DSD7_9BACT|nr:DNA polymerase Y family protein [Dyadobacter psychrotolerans]TDE17386.1 DNA polymerase Y family protein [Dyadobacter psychrotolerans]
MSRRYVNIWFPHLTTDRLIIRNPDLKEIAFVLASPERGRMVVKAVNTVGEVNGIGPGMVVADAKAVFPELQVMDYKPEQAEKLLNALAEWCIRYTPIVAVDLPDGLILDATGCAHLWGGEPAYVNDIFSKLISSGYNVRVSMADTVGAAWAVCRYGPDVRVVESGRHADALFALPPHALRLDPIITERMKKLGIYQIRNFIAMPRNVLRRRFGQQLLDRIDQALGPSNELITPVKPIEPYQERLPCLEPIVTATGIKIALQRLLTSMCQRFKNEGIGLRKAIFKGYRMDGKIEQIEIGTNGPSSNTEHLFKLFELKIATIEPAFGIELFILEAPVVEDMAVVQESLWNASGGSDHIGLLELLDRIAARAGINSVKRYLPRQHHWPERSVEIVSSLQKQLETGWRTDRPRPVHLLSKPESIVVTAPIPDYPPMLFRYKGKIHKVKKADGPERIEREWWLENGLHRDYYCLEDEEGARFWIFRLGHYNDDKPEWFVHGFFA